MYKYIYSYMYVYIFENMLTHLNQHLFDVYFLWVLDLFMCRKQKSIPAVKKNEEQSFTLQKALLHNRKLYYTADSFTAQQIALLYSKRFYYMTERFIARQKVLPHNRKFYYATKDFIAQQKLLPHIRKVSTGAKTREKPLLWQEQQISPLCSVFPWTWTQCLHTNWQRQSGTLEPIPQSARPNFLLKKNLD